MVSSGPALDLTVVSQPLRRRMADDRLAGLTPCKHEVLSHMAEGLSSHAIATKLLNS